MNLSMIKSDYILFQISAEIFFFFFLFGHVNFFYYVNR